METPAAVRPAWELITYGLRTGMLAAHELAQLQKHVREGRGITLRELAFRVVDACCEVRVNEHVHRADQQALLWCLQALAQSVGAPPYEREQATYTRIERSRIEETTVGELRGEQVGAANGYEDDYELPDGRRERGPTMGLFVLGTDQKHRLGRGSELTVRDITWTVRAVELRSSGNGWIELEAEVSADRSPAPPQTLDFLFESRCQRCGGQTGWDGGVDHSSGRPVVSTRCTRCPEIEMVTGGAVEAAWQAPPPTFTVGRGST